MPREWPYVSHEPAWSTLLDHSPSLLILPALLKSPRADSSVRLKIIGAGQWPRSTLRTLEQEHPMAHHDLSFLPDPDASECTLQALKVALEKAGSSLDRVLHLTIYLTDMADRAAFNEVYKRFFAKPWPVRAAVGVAALATEGMRVEVTAMAAKA